MYVFNKNVNYKIILFTLFSFCFSLKVFCASPDLRQAILDGINDDRRIRFKAPLKSDAIVAIKPLPDTGLHAGAVYEVQFKNKKPFICKQFKDKNQGDIEVDNFEWWRDKFKNSFDWSFAWDLPHFVKYKGSAEYVDRSNQVQKLILLEKAKGNSLGLVIANHVLDVEHCSLWEWIGKKLARYHLAFGETQGDTYVSYVHGDLHAANIFVDFSNLYFIDYTSLSHSKKDISIDLKQIFGHSYNHFIGPFLEHIKNTFYYNNTFISGLFLTASQRLSEVKKNIQSVFEKIKQGYINEFLDNGLNINIDGNGQATVTPKKKVDVAKVYASPVVGKPAPKVKAKPAPKAKAKLAAKKAKAKLAAKAKAKLAAKAKAKLAAKKAKLKPAPKAKLKPAPKAKGKPAPKAKLKLAPKAKLKPAPKAKLKPAPKAKLKPAPKAKLKPAPKAKGKPAPKAKLKPKKQSMAKVKASKKGK